MILVTVSLLRGWRSLHQCCLMAAAPPTPADFPAAVIRPCGSSKLRRPMSARSPTQAQPISSAR